MSRKNPGVKPMTEAQLEANLAAQEAAAGQGAENVADAPAPVLADVVAPTENPVIAENVPAAEWTPAPNYAKTIDGTLGRAAQAAASPAGAVNPASVQVLLSFVAPQVRAGTARAAALAALAGAVGQPRPVVLAAVAEAEQAWHRANGRTPGNCAPTGWLRTFNAVFGPAPVAEVAAEQAQEQAEA